MIRSTLLIKQLCFNKEQYEALKPTIKFHDLIKSICNSGNMLHECIIIADAVYKCLKNYEK